jgi:hypothetical protein
MAKAVQLNSQDRVRFRGHRGGLIPMHRALAHYGLDRVEIITAVVLVILLSSVWLLLLPQVCHFWTQVLDTGIRVLPLRAELGSHEYHLTSNVSLVVPYPGMETVFPDTRTWAVTGVVTILLFAVTYFLPSHLVPVIYLLRGALLIQATALVYFGLIPAEFPHTPSGYLQGLLAAGLALISTVPLLFGLTFYIFDFSLINKVSLTAMTMAHLVVFLPLQLLLQALVLQKTVLFMPVLYIIFGLPLDVLIIIGFYSWGMTWYFKSEDE